MTANRRALLTALKVADLSVIIASFILALTVQVGAHDLTNWMQVLEMRVKLHNALFLAIYLALWHFVLRASGLYDSYRLAPAERELRDLTRAVAIAILPLVVLAAPLQFQYVGSTFLALFSTSALLGLAAERRTLRAVGRFIRRYGRNLRNVIIVGTGDSKFDLMSKLTRRHDLGYHVAGVVDIDSNGTGNGAAPSDVIARVEHILRQQQIDEVFVALPIDTSAGLIQELSSLCEDEGVMIRLATRIAQLSWARAIIDEIDGEPVLCLHGGPVETPGLLVKRVIDFAGALAALVLFAPLFLFVAALIKLDTPGPVFFAQERVGYNRRRFRALKFRTMVAGAEELQANLESLNEASGPVFKIREDPRVTRIGKWLRRTSIDELPQLINVLVGEMSLVGPRPLPVRDVDRIDTRWHRRRFSVKPGITCLWQANSRTPDFDEWIKLDMEYIDNWSLALDAKILVMTIPAVLSGHGSSLEKTSKREIKNTSSRLGASQSDLSSPRLRILDSCFLPFAF